MPDDRRQSPGRNDPFEDAFLNVGQLAKVVGLGRLARAVTGIRQLSRIGALRLLAHIGKFCAVNHFVNHIAPPRAIILASPHRINRGFSAALVIFVRDMVRGDQ